MPASRLARVDRVIGEDEGEEDKDEDEDEEEEDIQE
jgi:hypothetical protein